MPRSHRTAVYARLVQPAYKPTLLIAQVDTASDADNRRLREIVDALKADNIPLVKFGDYDPAADYFAAFFEGKFWLLRPGQNLPCSVRRITDEERRKCESTRIPEQLFWSEPDDARALVSRAAKARNLVKLQSFSGSPASLKLKVEIDREEIVDPSGERKIQRLSLADHKGMLKAGDKVSVSVSNDSRDAWDIFFFYVDSDLGITPMQRYGESVRVESKGRIHKLVGTVNDQTVGTESLVNIADPRRDGREADYHFLAQGGYRKITTRGKGDRRLQSPLQSILEAVWEGDKNASLRGMYAPSPNGSQAHVKVFTWRVGKMNPIMGCIITFSGTLTLTHVVSVTTCIATELNAELPSPRVVLHSSHLGSVSGPSSVGEWQHCSEYRKRWWSCVVGSHIRKDVSPYYDPRVGKSFISNSRIVARWKTAVSRHYKRGNSVGYHKRPATTAP